jgi:hypothetical protein
MYEGMLTWTAAGAEFVPRFVRMCVCTYSYLLEECLERYVCVCMYTYIHKRMHTYVYTYI